MPGAIITSYNPDAPLVWVDDRQHPDLSKMQKGTHQLFSHIVPGGLLSANGRADFSNSRGEEETGAVHDYLLEQQTRLYREQTETME